MHKLRPFGFNAIKESFDRLPTAVCFFDRSGGIVLCNRQMYRLSQYLLNSDMQYLEELQKALGLPAKGHNAHCQHGEYLPLSGRAGMEI